MKKQFSKEWKASKQPRKQRKYLAKAPLHLRKKFVSVNLTKELRKKYGKRNIPLRKGDKVKVRKGKFKGKQEKVMRVNRKNLKVYLENIQVKKQDGSKANIPIRPANLQIIELNLEDKKRMEKKEEKKTEVKKETKQEESKK
jgi:large subunit ribosomal protein L24